MHRDCLIQRNTNTFYFHVLIQIFCTLFTCSVCDVFFVIDLFSNIQYSFKRLICPIIRLLLRMRIYKS